MKSRGCSQFSTEGCRHCLAKFAFLLVAATMSISGACWGQVNYVARFTLEKESVLLGEPIFCDFTLQNTGTRAFTFSYRFPDRVLNRELEQEPHFTIEEGTASPLLDPAPKPCGGANGTVVYCSASFPPLHTHNRHLPPEPR